MVQNFSNFFTPSANKTSHEHNEVIFTFIQVDELFILNEVEVAVDGIPVALSYLWESESICVIYEDGDIWTVAVSDWKVCFFHPDSLWEDYDQHYE